MADEEKTEDDTDAGTQKPSGGIVAMAISGVKMAMMGVVLIGFVVAANIGTLIMVKTMMPGLIFPDWMMAFQPEPEPELEVEEEDTEPLAPPVYTRINPQIIVSYQEGASVRFLQITLEAMARDEQSIVAFELNIPRIRNDLLTLFSTESLESLSTIEGRERMRARALVKVQEILAEEAKDARIEEVYFTSFVVQ